MDLSQLDTAEVTAVMEVRHPVSGEPLLTEDDQPITITLRSADSDEYETAMHDAQRSAARAAAFASPLRFFRTVLPLPSARSPSRRSLKLALAPNVAEPANGAAALS